MQEESEKFRRESVRMILFTGLSVFSLICAVGSGFAAIQYLYNSWDLVLIFGVITLIAGLVWFFGVYQMFKIAHPKIEKPPDL